MRPVHVLHREKMARVGDESMWRRIGYEWFTDGWPQTCRTLSFSFVQKPPFEWSTRDTPNQKQFITKLKLATKLRGLPISDQQRLKFLHALSCSIFICLCYSRAPDPRRDP